MVLYFVVNQRKLKRLNPKLGFSLFLWRVKTFAESNIPICLNSLCQRLPEKLDRDRNMQSNY